MTLDRIEHIKSDIMGKSSIRENELSKGLAAKTWENSNQGEIFKKERGNPENLMPWIIGEFKQGIKTIPKKIKSLVIYGDCL